MVVADVDVVLDLDQAWGERYRLLQALRVADRAAECMICGGRQRYEEGGYAVDAIYWLRDYVNMAPTCGRAVTLGTLRDADCGWLRSRDAKAWSCPQCSGAGAGGEWDRVA